MKKGLRSPAILKSRYKRTKTPYHRCGRCRNKRDLLLKVPGWSSKVCVICAKLISENLSEPVQLPTKKQLKKKMA